MFSSVWQFEELVGRVNYKCLCTVSTFHYSERVHWPKTEVYAESLPKERITRETLFKLPFLFRLQWQHLQCMWELTKTTFWMQRRPLCRCHSSTFSGFLLTCFLKWSAVWCRSDLSFFVVFFSNHSHLLSMSTFFGQCGMLKWVSDYYF